MQAEYGISANKIARLPNPLDLTDWQAVPRTEARQRLGLPLTARVTISHGRIDIFRKGLDLLLDAWSKLRAAHPAQDWRLVLIGSGDDASKFRSMLNGSGHHPFSGLITTFATERSCARGFLLPMLCDGVAARGLSRCTSGGNGLRPARGSDSSSGHCRNHGG